MSAHYNDPSRDAYNDGKYGYNTGPSNDYTLNERYRWEEGNRERQARNQAWEPPASSHDSSSSTSWSSQSYSSSDSAPSSPGVSLSLTEIIEFLIYLIKLPNLSKASFILFFEILSYGAFTGLKNMTDRGMSGFLVMGLLLGGCILYFVILRKHRNNFFICLIPVLVVGFLNYLVIDYLGHPLFDPRYNNR